MGNPNPPNQWKAGQSGNPNGRPKKESAMRALLDKYGEEEQEIEIGGEKMTVTRKEALAIVLWRKVMSTDAQGNVEIDEMILRHLLNRLEGLPTQRIAGEEGGEPIPLIIRRMKDVDGD